jgi:hypothetical protein
MWKYRICVQFIAVIIPIQTETPETQSFQFKLNGPLENFLTIRESFATQSVSLFSALSRGMFDKIRWISRKIVDGKKNLTSLIHMSDITQCSSCS